MNKKTNQNFRRIILVVAVLLLFIIVVTNSVNAQINSNAQFLGTFPQGQSVELLQLCGNSTGTCDYCNISLVRYPNSSIILSNVQMTKRQSDFNYSLYSNQTSYIGLYQVNGICGAGSDVMVWSYNFEITPSGQAEPGTGAGLSLIGLFFVMVVVSGFFLVMAWMSNNQVVKSLFIGLAAFIMATVVFFGMTTVTQILGGFNNLITGYNTFFFFILLTIVMAIFTVIIVVFVKSLKDMKIRKGALDPEHFQFEGEYR